jgi:L-fucose isomerase-like protein
MGPFSMGSDMPVNIIPIFSTIAEDEVVTDLWESLKETGANVFEPSQFITLCRKEPAHLMQRNFVFVGTGGTENLIADFLKEVGVHPPIILLSYDERNSLPAAMETRAYVASKGLKARIIHAPLTALLKRIRDWVEFSAVEAQIQGSTMGILGKPSSWLIASGIERNAVEMRWGLKFKDYSMEDFADNLTAELDPEFSTRLEGFMRESACLHIPEDDIAKAGLVTQELAKFVENKDLSAVSVECFTLLQRTAISGCHALSFLNDQEGLVAGCEGDIPSTFTMLLAKLLTKAPAFMANVAHIDSEKNSVVFAHCTIPTSLVESYEVMTHFETGMSVSIRGKIEPQRVTVVKVFGEDLSQFWVSGGTLVENLEGASSCRTQIRVELDESVDYFLNNSLANHHIVCTGDHSDLFKGFFSYILEDRQ